MIYAAILSIIIAAIAYLKIITPYQYWKKKNIPQLKPWPLIGNFGPFLLQQCSMWELTQAIYNSHPNERYFGLYQFFLPTLILKDPDLIKKITVKELETFPEHRTVVDEDIDPLIGKNIFFMKGGEKWHALRSTLSPAFTSSKMKLMFNLMHECATQFIKHLEDQNQFVTIEMKDAFTRYANDVIGSVAFGVTCNSMENKENEFYLMGKEATDINPFRALKMFLPAISPTLMKIMRLTIMPKEIINFFQNTIKESIAIRLEKGIQRPDMIHLLLEAKRGRLKYDQTINDDGSEFAVIQESEMGQWHNAPKTLITDEDITAQAFGFFLAGFDTSSTAMSFAAYELALNSDIQQRLQNEVDKVLLDNNGNLTCESLLSMKYMDQVISETLRKWPPVTFTDRKAVKPFTIEPKLPHEKRVHLDVDTVCWIPIYAIHRDPKYYPNPELFDPERFSEENKQNIKHFTYLPFGMGPKGCIASRFALLECKLIIFTILSKFSIVPVDKTQVPFKPNKKKLFLAAENGIWVGLKPRNVN